VNDGCGTITNGADLVGKIVVVDRGACPFTVKAQAIQDAGGAAVVIANNQAGAPIAAGGTSTTITIPVVMISNVDGASIKGTLLSGTVNATLQASGPSVQWDSDLDNGVIAHEYGHGISTRLTGGPGNSDCLQNAEQMGEGWSDWIALMLTMEPGDQGSDVRGIATYLLGEPVSGTGLRPAAYSTDPAVNDFTYAATNDEFNISQPHGIGFVWTTMLWDLNWALIGEHGFDPDLYHGTGGNNIAMRLVIDGMKLQPCSPGFVDGRDAILQADSINYGGANHCLIWHVFAARGLGFSADQGSSLSRTDQEEAFDLPLSCLQEGVDETGLFGGSSVSVVPNPTHDRATLVLGAVLKENIDVTLLSAEGRVVRSYVLKAGEASITFELGDLAPGMYTIGLRSLGSVLRRSIVVIH
ncbi:MAG: M36 family metallopeptidase, partial [Flavobacteriales bacterium]